jgi:hypothetical protein
MLLYLRHPFKAYIYCKSFFGLRAEKKTIGKTLWI